MSDDVPEWALREARERLCCCGSEPDEQHTYACPAGPGGAADDVARMLTAAEQQGHERGVREERERAVEKCDALAREQQATAGRMDEAGWAEAAALCIRSADTARLLACTIASGTPGDTEPEVRSLRKVVEVAEWEEHGGGGGCYMCHAVDQYRAEYPRTREVRHPEVVLGWPTPDPPDEEQSDG